MEKKQTVGMSLVFSIWVFFRVTGAAFNPNIAFTLVLLGAITPFRFVLYVFAQLLGAIAAAGVLQGLLPGELNVNCAPGNGIGIAQVRKGLVRSKRREAAKRVPH